MSVQQVLTRVEDDLAVGHRPRARQRLKSLVGAYPQRLDVRERLAELYRLDGDVAQAGRWGYLGDNRTRAEVEAFEKAYREDPVRMMRAVGWRGPEEAAETDLARQRLRALRARAEAEFGVPVDWELPRHEPEAPPGLGVRVVGWGCVVLAIVLVGLVLIGVVSVAMEGADVVGGWLD